MSGFRSAVFRRPRRNAASPTNKPQRPLVASDISTKDGMIIGDSDQTDDYDRACGVEGLAEVIGLRGCSHVSALALGDEPATTCYLPEQRASCAGSPLPKRR